MKKILILGAGPNATIPEVDIVYAANAAIGFYKNEIEKIKQKVSLVSSGELSPALRMPGAAFAEQYQVKFELIQHAPCDLHVSVHDDKYPEGIASLRMAGFSAPVKSLTSKDYRNILKKVSNLTEPLFCLSHYLARPTLRGFLSISKLYISEKRSLIDGAALVSPFFRNSTGMIALVYAISENGPEAEYFVSGIGFRRRNSYQNGQKTSDISNKNWRLAQHVVSDIKVCNNLKRKYSINFV